ncbi:MAG TPA: Xaa-Pro peptidase family protein [Thermodesulfobacteriota bacterium]|nr:Xaa-Pro peptidase family protein [Thermodesulfobacteriota bacterium]
MKKDTYLIIDTSEDNADLYYRTGFFVPDPVIYIEHRGKKILVLSDLEIDRGRKEATVDRVLSLTEYQKRLLAQKVKKLKLLDVADLVLRDLKIKKVVVPGRFSVKYADGLRKRGYTVVPRDEEPFFEERLRKTPREIGMIRDSMKETVRAMDLAVKMIASSEIRKQRLYLKGGLLTSERVKGEINAELSRKGLTASHTIVACGVHSSMPHHGGEGPIYADKPVVVDIFPRSQASGYFGDMTRTVVRGEPSPVLVKMYDTVLRGQKLAIGMVKAGVRVKDIHSAVVDYFRSRGFETGVIGGKAQGFIHSTGHGLGLEIHEPPRISLGDEILEAGNVVTVEPGLYYEKTGGVRIEDVVVVEKNGCTNLTRYPKKLVAKI